ncbi:hypothetical protein EDD18DRAFT_1426428 [Armillaria luteobubalina]|uniref:Uncharacterized protein n=1 Tax=Armillaria luteobubalina TaxID=153913 RepID=A0AA39QH52_9AGAR|nr:hypothetical protein EDD18DRAFT_1426428 [Armillaria luteobubalina]
MTDTRGWEPIGGNGRGHEMGNGWWGRRQRESAQRRPRAFTSTGRAQSLRWEMTRMLLYTCISCPLVYCGWLPTVETTCRRCQRRSIRFNFKLGLWLRGTVRLQAVVMVEDVGDAWFRNIMSFVVSVSGLGGVQLVYDRPRQPSQESVGIQACSRSTQGDLSCVLGLGLQRGRELEREEKVAEEKGERDVLKSEREPVRCPDS